MTMLKDCRIVVTGGTHGLGRGIVESLARQGADVTVIARSKGALDALANDLGVKSRTGDIADRAFAESTIREVRPQVLILNAGATPAMGLIHHLSWEAFSEVWNTDVKAALFWIQAALLQPLAAGSRVLLGSSGAAIAGSPLSGGYAGAKRMLWLMAGYANGVATKDGLGINFQALLPNQIIAGTGVGEAAAAAYAQARGVGIQEFFAGFGKPLEPRLYGELVAEILTNPAHEAGTAFAFRGDNGIVPLEG